MPSNERRKKWQELTKILRFSPPLCGVTSSAKDDFHIDIIRLDEQLKTPDGVSLAQHIENKYGKRAKDLVKELI